MTDMAELTERDRVRVAREDALFEASKARMSSNLAAAQSVMAAAPEDLYPVTTPQTIVPREDGRYDLGCEAEPAPASSSAVAARVEVVGAHMSYGGLPAVIAEDGTTRVRTSHGDLTVETLRALNLDMDEERLLSASRFRMGVAA